MPILNAMVLAALVAASSARAAADPGTPVDDVQLPSLSGGQVRLLQAGATAHVLVFVKTNHPHCLEALQELADREGKPAGAHWVAILPGDTSPEEGRALAAAAGVKMPFLIDIGDKVYGRLAIALHPTVAILDKQGKLATVEPYRRIQFADRVTARVRFALGEITQAQLAAEEDPALAENRTTDEGAARHHEKFAGKLLEAGQLDMALTEVGKGLAGSPSAAGYFLQARILKKLGRCAESTKALEVAKKMEPDRAEAALDPTPCTPGSRSP